MKTKRKDGVTESSLPQKKKNLIGAFLPPFSPSPKRLLMRLFEISTEEGVKKKKGEKKKKKNSNAVGKEGGCASWIAEITHGLVFGLIFCSRHFQERL